MRGWSDPAAFHRSDERAAYHYMDAMRFVAALTVVVGHALSMVWGPPEPGVALAPWSWAVRQLMGLGHQAVMVFFVLSGFWITHSAVRHLDRERFWPEFLIDRVSRLHIVVVPALAFGAVLDVLGASLFKGSVYRGGLGLEGLSDGVYNHLTAEAFGGSLVFLQGLAVPEVGTNAPLWSVAFEFWYYIWFAALAVSIMRRRPSSVLLMFVLGAIWPSLFSLFPIWLMGSLVYFADRRRSLQSETSRRWAFAVMGAGVIAMAAVLVIVRLGLLKIIFCDLLIGLAFSLVLWGMLRDAAMFPQWLAPVARYGATASFSLYVTHYPLFAFVLSAAGYNTRRGSDVASLALIVGLCLIAVATGWLFSRLTEVHTARLRRLIKFRLQPAARG